MRMELLGSALVHAAAFGTALLWVGLPQPDDAPSMGAMEVELIAMASVSANASDVIESDAAVDQVSAGAEQAVPVEAVVPEMLEPQSETAVEPTPAEAVANESPPAEIPLLVASLEAIAPEEFAAPVPQEAPLEPVETSDLTPAPVPHVLSFTRPTTPTPRPQAAPRQTAAPKPQQAGSGGNSNADTAAASASAGQAGAGSGGSADVARYPGQVQNKLRRALRYPRDARGDSGEALVYFVVDSGGQVVSLNVARSSGNPIIDQAALDTVRRAAPFPAIPGDAGRNSWDFTIPLTFRN